MSVDIVARLRLRPTILRKNRFGDMETDRAATALFDDCHAIMREAADEIDRLRRNTGCARNQRSTQFCAEALDAQRDVETLKTEVLRNADEFRETLTELRQRVETLTAERDEARRMACKYEARYVEERDYPLDPPDEENIQRDTRRIAAERGWDCFKEDGK